MATSGGNQIFADPYFELPFRSDKYAGVCEEMHLGERKITDLKDFKAFISLAVLWINDNDLTSFDGLETNFRLKEIYAHNNKFARLGEECLSHVTFLSKLTLSNNKLDDLENVIEELKPLAHLQHLDLFDNPIAQVDNYRLRMIGELSTLHILDRHEITEEERVEAAKYMKKMAKLANFSLQKKKVVIPKYTPEEEENRKATLNAILLRFRNKTFKFRIQLESFFMLHDKRNIGKINDSLFWGVLDETNLTPLLEDEFEREVLIEKYTVNVMVEAISMTGTMRKEWIWWRKFCEDVLRSEVRLIADETWTPSMAPEISVSTKDLMSFVSTVKINKKREEEDTRRNTLMANAQKTEGGENVFGDRLGGRKNKCEEHGLNVYQAGELIKVIDSVGKDGTFTMVQIESILKKMANFSVTPELGLKGAKEAMSLGGSKTEVTLVEIKDALGVSIVSSSDDMPVIKWRQLKPAEQDKVTNKLFGDAASLLDSLLRTNPGDNTDELLRRTTTIGIHATRMRSLKTKVNKGKAFVTPGQALSSAPLRADVMIIPNLLPDVAKIAKQKELLGKADWSQHLENLGLKGEYLEVGVERKKRSVLKAARRRIEREEEKVQEALARSLSAPELGGAGGDKTKGKGQVEAKKTKPRKNLVPEDDGGPRGWAMSTGYVVVGK